MKIKIIVGVSLFFFFVTLVSIITAGLISNELKKNVAGQANTKIGLNTGNGLGQTGTSEGVSGQDQIAVLTLTNEEVAKHGNTNDCWITIDQNVYNVTSFIANHPGGSGPIVPYCGKDASNAYKTKDEKPPSSHTSFANNLLANYYIGKIGESLPIAPLANQNDTPTNTAVVLTPTRITQRFPTAIPTTPLQLAQVPIANPAASSVTLITSEISTHNTTQNCWIIVSGSVYDVTSYIFRHPGGVNAIANTCGTDATTAFNTRGGTGSHSNNARNLLGQYLIGTVGSSIPVNSTPAQTANTGTAGSTGNTAPTPTTPPVNNNGGGSSSSIPASVQTKYPGATYISGDSEDDGRVQLKINFNGQCRDIKVNSAGSITEDKSC